MDKSALEVLLERLEKAEGPDREIDFDLHILECESSCWADVEVQVERAKRNGVVPYTASLDASIALVERIEPKWEYILNWRGWASRGRAFASVNEASAIDRSIAYHDTSVIIALLTAMVKALIAEEKNRADHP